MPDHLELTVDKFRFKVAKDRFYSREGVWLLPSTSPIGVTVRMGLSDYLQQHSGDIAFVNLKPTGTALNTGDEFAKISGGSVAREVSVLDVFRRYKELKPEGIADLNQPGKELARTIAGEISEDLDEIIAPVPGGNHA